MANINSLCLDDKRIRRADCAHCAIRKKMLFADLDLESVGSLLETVTNSTLAPGASIYHQGQSATAVYSLRDGIVKLSKVSRDGDLRIVRLLGPGAAIGLESLVEQQYEHTAEAIARVDLCRIPVASLHPIAQQQPQLHQRLMQQWSMHADIADRHLLDLSTGPVRDRVFRLLAMLQDLSTKPDSLLLPSNQDCAALLGARIESVSRCMAELKREQTLVRDGKKGWHFRPPGAALP
jgi:CRP-like cAMP-binding protein